MFQQIGVGSKNQNNTNRFLYKATVLACGAIFLSGCVNDSGKTTLSSAKVEATQSSHEENFIAKKCTSNDRLRSSNIAGNALTTALTTYSEKEVGLSDEVKTRLTAKLQEHGATLQQLDQDLNTQCRSYSACEFQASTNKQDCTSQKHKFLDSEKAMSKFADQVGKLKI